MVVCGHSNDVIILLRKWATLTQDKMESFPDLEGKTSENSNISFHMGLYSTLMVMVIAQSVFFLAIIPVFTAL